MAKQQIEQEDKAYQDFKKKLQDDQTAGFEARVNDQPPIGANDDGSLSIYAPGEPRPKPTVTIVNPDGTTEVIDENESGSADLSDIDDYEPE